MGWSKRGTGKSYNSKNGYGAIIGFLSKKILDYHTRNKQCRQCDLGKPPESHDCRKNYHTSSRAMEASVGTELILNSQILKQNNLEVKVIIGDEDSSLMPAIDQANPGHKIRKIADNNHVMKNFGEKLYKLQSSNLELTKKGLMSDIKKCFSYAVAQNRSDTLKLAAAIRSIPHHLYNNHENCGLWCKTRQQGSLHKPKFTPRNEKLHQALSQLFNEYGNNGHKLCTKASSQINEAFNKCVTHKLPKIRASAQVHLGTRELQRPF
ncbi:hypothetical protein QAD02_013124 [Eretmocerus hayati]|uniref:Uncharacterized protein n=1 Tax=Eretmocerus hayati TaxID=131215 RepID=A0ACC2P4I0_9HYME|nr:hypothetical protein QAD02_013124 [Eretmocerus hayati]